MILRPSRLLVQTLGSPHVSRTRSERDGKGQNGQIAGDTAAADGVAEAAVIRGPKQPV